jgi:hypothetical protein
MISMTWRIENQSADLARDVDVAAVELIKPSRHASPHSAIVDAAEPTETRFMRKKDILADGHGRDEG